VLTVLLIVASTLGLASGKGDWVLEHGFTAQKYLELLTRKDASLLSYIPGVTFAQLTPWLWVLNGLFFWLFGSVCERKLIGWRYPAFLLIGLVGWCMLVAADTSAYDAATRIFVGPTMFLLYILGGYIAFFPRKPFKPAIWVRPPWKVYKEEAKPLIAEEYWVAPGLYVGLFAAYVILLQLGLSHSSQEVSQFLNHPLAAQAHKAILGPFQAPVYAVALVPGMETILLGYVVAFLLASVVTRPVVKRAGGNLQLMVLEHYRELRTLDMTHEQAVEGASKFTAVPIEITRDWIAKGLAGVKDKEKKG
jgi:hypothetical protein